MAYTKQTWTNDVTAITAERMTHIEQGIYDNSLASDKINPSGTATTTAEIEEGQINDVIGFKSLKLKGQTSQYTTTGKNLLIPFATTTQSSNGITRTTNNDGSVTLSGTATANSYLRITENITLESNTSYTTLNQNANLPNGVTIYYNDVSNIGVAYNDTALIPNARVKSYTTGTVTGAITIAILVQSGTSFSTPVTLYPMLVKGTVTTSNIPTYEPYTGGIASPNPDFPQDVNNVSGDNVIGIQNKNLIEYSFKGYNINSQGKFETGGTSLDFDVHIAKVKAGTTYTITPATNVIAYFDEKPTITSQAYNNTREVITSTNRLTPTRSGYIAMRTATSNTAQLEKGSSSTSYIAHQGNNFEINLGAIELCKIGIHQDYIYKKDGKWYKYKAIEKLILNGSEAWTLNETGTNTLRFVDSTLISSKPAFNKAPQFFMNNTYQEYNGNTEIASVDVEGIAMRDDNKGFAVRMLKSRITNKDGFIAWLSTNKPEIYYVLATPIEEEITYAPLLRQLDELYNSGLYDVTNISQDNSSEAFILDLEACKNNINGIVEYIRR